MKTTRVLQAIALSLFVSLMVAPAAYCGEKVDETRDVDSDAAISISILSGHVTVTAWDKNQLKVTGSLDSKAEGYEITGSKSDMHFKVKYPHRYKSDEGSTLEFMVPAKCRLSVKGVSTETEIKKLEGEIQVNSVSGDVDVDATSPRVEIGCVSGDVSVSGVEDRLEISIVSGDAKVKAHKLSELKFNSVSGNFTLGADATKDADWSIRCHSGDVELSLPASIDAAFDISTFSGDIHNAFGQAARRTSEHAPGKKLSFSNGNGDARIEISVFSGTVRLEKN
jgi:DUF4097 and DUF4098 domain-containing protein YvlB